VVSPDKPEEHRHSRLIPFDRTSIHVAKVIADPTIDVETVILGDQFSVFAKVCRDIAKPILKPPRSFP
jgi:hypothetical protein